MVQTDRQDNTIWRVRFACWIKKTTDTHTQNMKQLLLRHCQMVKRMRFNITFIRILALLLFVVINSKKETFNQVCIPAAFQGLGVPADATSYVFIPKNCIEI
jgi:hypothetical protein